MVNVNELKACIVREGLTQEQVSKSLGMSPKTFYNRLKRGVFGSDEIEKLIILLHIKNPMQIFFSDKVTLEVTN